MRIGLYPNQGARGVAWYWACLVGGPPAGDGARPRRGALWVPARWRCAEGLWADHTVEVPFDHVTLGCEAFALALDDPAAVYGEGGVPGANGCCSGSTSSGAPTARPTPTLRAPPATRCRAGCTARCWWAASASSSTAQRDHSWGVRDWWTVAWTWTAGWLEDGTRYHGTHVRLGDDTVPYHLGYVQPAGGPLTGVDHTASHSAPGLRPAGIRRGGDRRAAPGRDPCSRWCCWTTARAWSRFPGAVPRPRPRHGAPGRRLDGVEPAPGAARSCGPGRGQLASTDARIAAGSWGLLDPEHLIESSASSASSPSCSPSRGCSSGSSCPATRCCSPPASWPRRRPASTTRCTCRWAGCCSGASWRR